MGAIEELAKLGEGLADLATGKKTFTQLFEDADAQRGDREPKAETTPATSAEAPKPKPALALVPPAPIVGGSKCE